MDCHKLHMRYENEGKEKEIAECKKMNKAIDCLKLHMRYESEGEEKEIGEWEKKNKQKHWRISSYIWSRVVVCDSDIRNFIQIRLTQQWSSFSRMILWWSDCSASTTVLQQLTSNVKWIVCDEKKSLSKLLRQLFMLVIYRNITCNTNELHKFEKRHHKWQRSDAVENVSTYAHKHRETNILLINFQ